MSTKWIVGFVVLFVVGSMIAGVCEMQYLGGQYGSSDDPIALLERLFSWREFIFVIPEMFWWNYAMFTGHLAIVRWVLLMPISIGTFYGLVSLAVSVIGSTASSISSLFRLR